MALLDSGNYSFCPAPVGCLSSEQTRQWLSLLWASLLVREDPGFFSLLCWADARLHLHSPLNSSPPTTVEMLVTELEDTASELCTAHCELLSPGLLLQRFPCTAPRCCTTGVYLLLNWPSLEWSFAFPGKLLQLTVITEITKCVYSVKRVLKH